LIGGALTLSSLSSSARLSPVSVVVVGAGPTGLTIANLLGRYGVSTLLVEKNPTTVQEPRAVSIDDESLRTMQAAGLIDTVLQHVVAGYGSRYLSPKGRTFLDVAPTEVIYGYPRRNAFRQPVLEQQLREGLERFPHVQTLFGWRVESFEQDDEGVTLRCSDEADRSIEVGCDYLIGCDGASSFIRTALGLSLEGMTFSEKWLIVDLENSPSPTRDTLVFCDANRPCIALPGPNLTRRFEFKLHPGESPEAIMAPASVAALLAKHGAAVDSIIKRQTVYTFHARLAQTWARGRIYLAGDACHLTPPFAGQGMNSGIRDAHNLAWKLAAVVQGRLGAGVLHSYERERRDHVDKMIELALRMGQIMGPANRLKGTLTRLVFYSLNIWPPAKAYFAQMKYKPKPRFKDGFLVPDQRRRPRDTPVGRLLPQPDITLANGQVVKLDEVLGDGFALVGLRQSATNFERLTRHDVWSRLGVQRVLLQSDSAPLGRHESICLATIPPGVFGDLDRGAKDVVLFVRPDRYVAAAFSISEADIYADAIKDLCAQTWSGDARKQPHPRRQNQLDVVSP